MANEYEAQRAALADFGLFAFRCGDLDELLTRAAELVSEALGVELVKVLEHRPEQGDFLLRAGVNWAPGVVGHVTFADHENSPAGYALLSGEPVVSRDVDTETRFQIPEVLLRHNVKSMINVIIVGEEDPFGVLEVDAQGRCDFGQGEIAFLRTYANLLAAAIERMRQHEALERQAREQSILARELGHRVTNVLSLVQALAKQTSADSRSAVDFRDEFLGRLRALSAAESLVFEDRGENVDLRRIAEDVVAPHRQARAEAIALAGPAVGLSAQQGRMIGLALHELATNAAKHGALSVPEGRVELEWHREEGAGQPRIVLHWQEFDGPRVAPPEQRGFGSRLLETIVGAELGGEVNLDHHPEGVAYRLVFPCGEAPQSL
ncbi:hypothetical protein OB2597_05405 [Pseudooceanicola batsensis HTCC2597]|uniref:histidine kinase n=1 Tax=Pseudooceanicola batsensis (strain ATCC BAA-863 / DSM 15984 / KCTC 12145 / HTCC2597) TaxID=252305 RepID=A3TSR6_PSEBH|nr:HWE histidine kinase domain-containing protein [Pseudooceanicola batsensis]EAQ04693.1 hypothetical protein OB2597_05405 [Pseudooceanicola batsensis HTCC2597]